MHLNVGVQPTMFSTAIQQNYFPHTKHVTLERYDKDEPLDLAPFTSLEQLYIENNYTIDFPSVREDPRMQWLTDDPQESSLRSSTRG